MALGQTYDYELEKSNLDRRQQIINALRQQSLQPIGVPIAGGGGQVQARLSPVAAIGGPVTQALLANFMQNQQAAKQSELGNRYRQDLTAGIDKYLTTAQGEQGPSALLISPDGSSRMERIGADTPGDSKRAMLEALASNHPVLQQLGMSQLQALGKKDGLSEKDLLGLSGYDARSKVEAALARDASKLRPEVKEHVVDGRIVAGVPGGVDGYKVAGDFRPRYGQVGQVAEGAEGKPIFGQTETSTGKVTFAPAGTSVNVDTGAKAGQAFAKQLGEKRADILTKSYEKAQTASESLQALNAASEDFAAGIKSGAPAQIALGLAKWGKALGIEADPSIANTEAFRANMAQQVLSSVKALGSGTGISNADRDYAEKAAGGAITLDDQAMFRLMNIARASAANSLINHHALLERNMNASGAVPEDLETFRVPFTIPVGDDLDWSPSTGKVVVKSRGPAAPKPGTPSNAPIPGQDRPASSGGVVEWADYLKSKGVR